LEDQNLEGLNLMLAWRDFLAGGAGIEPKEVNILSYVELWASRQVNTDRVG